VANSWESGREGGSAAAIRFGAAIYQLLGRRCLVALMWLPALYFFARKRAIREASRDFLRAVASVPGGGARIEADWRASLLHLREFSVQLLDRFVSWANGGEGLVVSYSQEELLVRAIESGKGALIVAAHMGSFDMMRLLARRYDLRVNVVMYTENAQRINDFFAELDPSSRARVISVDPTSIRTAFEMRACLARGEAVAILGDRLRPGSRERVLRRTFLGRSAAFPVGPFLLASVLGAPLLMARCRRTGDGAYHVSFRELSPGERAPRQERAKRAGELLSRFVSSLEEDCLDTPLQWFNFYDFWGAGDAALAESAQ